MTPLAATLTDALHAIARDVETTLGWVLEPVCTDAEAGLWSVDKDGAPWIPPSPASSLPGWIQHEVIDALATAWPRCPVHRTHPLRLGLRARDGANYPAGWICDADEQVRFALGELPASCGSIEDPPITPNTVRWYLRGEGWGVIASEARDLWFNVPGVAAGSLPLAEGDRVTYDVDERPHDAFPARAVNIRRVI